MIIYILTMFVFGTFLMASDYSQSETKPTPTITINDDAGWEANATASFNVRRLGTRGLEKLDEGELPPYRERPRA